MAKHYINTLLYYIHFPISNILFPSIRQSPATADDTASHFTEKIDDTRGELLIFPSPIPPTFLLL